MNHIFLLLCMNFLNARYYILNIVGYWDCCILLEYWTFSGTILMLYDIGLVPLRLAFNLLLGKTSLNLELIMFDLSLPLLRLYPSQSLSCCPNNMRSLSSRWWKYEMFPALHELWELFSILFAGDSFPSFMEPQPVQPRKPCTHRMGEVGWVLFRSLGCVFSLSLFHILPANSTCVSYPKPQLLSSQCIEESGLHQVSIFLAVSQKLPPGSKLGQLSRSRHLISLPLGGHREIYYQITKNSWFVYFSWFCNYNICGQMVISLVINSL